MHTFVCVTFLQYLLHTWAIFSLILMLTVMLVPFEVQGPIVESVDLICINNVVVKKKSAWAEMG